MYIHTNTYIHIHTYMYTLFKEILHLPIVIHQNMCVYVYTRAHTHGQGRAGPAVPTSSDASLACLRALRGGGRKLLAPAPTLRHKGQGTGRSGSISTQYRRRHGMPADWRKRRSSRGRARASAKQAKRASSGYNLACPLVAAAGLGAAEEVGWTLTSATATSFACGSQTAGASVAPGGTGPWPAGC